MTSPVVRVSHDAATRDAIRPSTLAHHRSRQAQQVRCSLNLHSIVSLPARLEHVLILGMDYGLVLFTSDRGITPAAAAKLADEHGRSEERRVGKACRCGWARTG